MKSSYNVKEDLINMEKICVSEGFVKDAHRSMLMVEENPVTLLDRFATYEPPRINKWIGREDT